MVEPMDLEQCLVEVEKELRRQSEAHRLNYENARRLHDKAEGVALALTYVREYQS